MPTQHKKELELHWLESARKIRPDLFAGEIKSSEAPDFLRVHHGRRLGVALTRYSNPPRDGEPVPEEQTGLRWKVVALGAILPGSSCCRVRIPYAARVSPQTIGLAMQ